jgi:hypothetical protein
MFLAHSFRLRDPWQCEATDDGGLRWSRIFHRPTGLEPDDDLVLVISGLPPDAAVTINGHAFVQNFPAPSPCAGRDGEGGDAGTSSPSQSACATGILPVPAAGTSPDQITVGSRTAAQAAQFNVTPILTETNRIDLLIPPQASGLKPQASSPFPYDARLAILGHS